MVAKPTATPVLSIVHPTTHKGAQRYIVDWDD